MLSNNVAEAIVAQLAAAGVSRMYGVIGDAVFPLAHALEKQRAVTFVAATHETNAAYMASYEAKLTGRPVACMATAGPGATNLATGLADAHFDGAPVIAITGQVPSTKIGTGAKQYFDQQTFFRPITASSELAVGGEAALHAVLSALNRAVMQSTVTHVSIPRDVFEHPVQWSPLALEPGPRPVSNQVVGNETEAFERLQSAQRPLLLLGTSQPDAVRESLALAETIGAAVVVAQQAKGAVPHDNDRLIGGIGEAHVPHLVNDCDLLVLIGDAPYEVMFIPPNVPSIIVTPTHRAVSKHPLITEWIGDVHRALRTLREHLKDRHIYVDAGWQRAIQATRTSLEVQVAQLRELPGAEQCNPYELALTLSAQVAEDAVIAVDVGAFSHWFDLGFRAKRQAILASARWRGIGFALPAAIGAQFAYPGRQVVAVVGDGAFLQAMGELTTAVRYELPLVIVVVNNATYDIEQQKMAMQGFGSLGTALPTPDFVAYAEACGATGVRVAAADQLGGALERGLRLSQGRPVVLDVRTTVPALPHLVGAT